MDQEKAGDHISTDYERFTESRQEKIRLDMAIRIFCHETDKDLAHRTSCRSYLKLRHKAAAEKLILSGDLPGLRAMLEDDLIPEKEKEGLIALAAEKKQTDCMVAVLTGGKKRMPVSRETGTKLWIRILSCLGRDMDRKYPALGHALHLLQPEADASCAGIGCDGFDLYIHTERLAADFKDRRESLKRDLAHVLAHQVLFHPGQAAIHPVEERLFDACCDCITEWTLDVRLQYRRPVSEDKEKRRQSWYRYLTEKGLCSAAALYRHLLAEPGQQTEELYELFHCDEHRYWYEKKHSPAEWIKKKQQIRRFFGDGAEHTGGSIRGAGGSGFASYKEPEASEFSYKEFLEDFMVMGEERQLNLEDFDPLLYNYSRTHYERAVFLEPLETSEVKRLSEIVIAIDTSGSCSGEIVQQFLRETFSILEKKEHFFRKMRVHILQCDSMIQDYRLIEGEEDFKAYRDHLKIKGFGYTDFRPVFSWVEKMKEKGEIRDLKGLIYFTDGAGVYPKTPPVYKTAFVFLNDQLKKGEVPPWGRQLNLSMDRKFDNLFDDEREGRIKNGWVKT